MKRGLVIGKFLPIHKGHIALIEFAALQCDELIVSMSFTDHDPIDPALRLSWIKSIFEDQPNIKPAMIHDDFDDDQLPWDQRTRKWAEVIKSVYPKIDALFSSESYGEPFASSLGVPHYSFDPGRGSVPVSATLIRNHPLRHWEFIPKIVQPYFVKKICFYGPESTGKTFMSQRMATLFNTTLVPEVAREFLVTNNFTLEDIARIGIAHHQRIQQEILAADKLLMCDTDAITTQIYSRHYLGEVPPVLYELERLTSYDHYFLFDIDVPWIADGLRDLGDDRKSMFGIFQQELEKRKIPYTLVQGTYEERQSICEETLRKKFF
jgi:HTH-type transcriptional regulator, transcriptional repressor of NAD biosynthesis genes